MKTLKYLRKATIFQWVFIGSCVLSSALFLLHAATDVHLFVGLGILAMYGWIINPVGPVGLYFGLKAYLTERTDPDWHRIIGKRWHWFIAWIILDTILFVVAVGIMVAVTGGV